MRKKIKLIKQKNPCKHIEASMWFVDDSLVKNRNYYQTMINNEKIDSCTLHLYYGEQFFASLKDGKEAWSEFIEILTRYRMENSNVDVEVPDFGTSDNILNALLQLPDKYWTKLYSPLPQFILLRKELFSGGNNLEIAKERRHI